VRADAGGLQVVCGDGSLVELVDVQPEGRRAMTGREFLAGRQIAAGTQLSSGPP
jgi:methionyl-tRNA formyltransferase